MLTVGKIDNSLPQKSQVLLSLVLLKEDAERDRISLPHDLFLFPMCRLVVEREEKKP